MFRALAWSLCALAMTAAPAAASTFPAADLPDEGTTVTVGASSLSVDQPIWRDLTVGAFGNYFWPLPGTFAGGGARLTYRLGGSADGPAWGMSLAAGQTHLALFEPADYTWVQPSLTATLPLGDSGFILRGAIGPAIFLVKLPARQQEAFNLFPVPNVELAYRYGPGFEVAFGGGDLASLRMRF
jgi:hypothetical protein